ncbi:MAG: PLP-dependent transferase [Planctomycetes bacterium]|nr:PLP-dependent transferase [Planctomycetota bacterium]
MSTSERKFATRCIHAGYRASPASPAVVAPLVTSTTFLLDDASYAHMLAGRADEALIYTRLGNPTLDVVQERLASLEGTEHALVFASGMAAIHAALLACLPRGGGIVAHRELYGSTWDLMVNVLAPYGIRTTLVDLDDPKARKEALAQHKPQVVYCESVSNPTLHVADLPAIASDAHAVGARMLVDATFASPALQRPAEFGVDLVIHSATKYLGGHSDLTAGVVAGREEDLRGVYRWLQLAGGCLDPHSAALLERGLKTLPLRMRAHCANASALARHLAAHPKVAQVLHPSLAAHRSHATAKRVLPDFGGMLSFVVKGGDEAALRCVRALELALEASSLGGVETLVSLPFNTSHARFTPAQRAEAGMPPGFVRVSVGVEDLADLVADFDQALAR